MEGWNFQLSEKAKVCIMLYSAVFIIMSETSGGHNEGCSIPGELREESRSTVPERLGSI